MSVVFVSNLIHLISAPYDNNDRPMSKRFHHLWWRRFSLGIEITSRIIPRIFFGAKSFIPFHFSPTESISTPVNPLKVAHSDQLIRPRFSNGSDEFSIPSSTPKRRRHGLPDPTRRVSDQLVSPAMSRLILSWISYVPPQTPCRDPCLDVVLTVFDRLGGERVVLRCRLWLSESSVVSFVILCFPSDKWGEACLVASLCCCVANDVVEGRGVEERRFLKSVPTLWKILPALWKIVTTLWKTLYQF